MDPYLAPIPKRVDRIKRWEKGADVPDQGPGRCRRGVTGGVGKWVLVLGVHGWVPAWDVALEDLTGDVRGRFIH